MKVQGWEARAVWGSLPGDLSICPLTQREALLFKA